MAHIDGINCLDRQVRRHFRRVFERLDDDFLIRQPALDSVKIAPCIIESRHCWLFVGAYKDFPEKQAFDTFLRFNDALQTKGLSPVRYLAVVESIPASFTEFPDYIQFVSQEDFYRFGEKIISQNMTEFSAMEFARIKAKLFVEAYIPVQCSTRKPQQADNSAQLLPFFLDYDQEQATKLDLFESVDREEEKQEEFSVRLINGVAGSGKTLILVNRAMIFCKKFPNKTVRLLIHNKPIVEDLKLRMKIWWGGVPDNLEVQTFHSFAWNQYRAKFCYVKGLFKEKELEPAKKLILTDENSAYRDLSLKDEQIWSELEYISDYLIKDKAEYLDYERQGRGFALQKSQREHIWQLYEILMAKLSDPKQGFIPHLYIKQLALTEKTLPSFDHIMIDEAQFFSPSWLEVVKRSLSSDGSIFMCADPNQGFLKSRLSWKSVGLNVRGRTKRLNHSYRTTYEIMVAANALLEGLDANPEDYVKPDLTNMLRGAKPQIVYSSTPQDELSRFLNELESIVKSAQVPFHQIMVLCSPQYHPWVLKKNIEQKIGSDTVINYNNNNELATIKGERIKLLNINSCTGMEAATVMVLGAGHILNQAQNLQFSASEKEEAQQEALRKLYVAMTRAGQKLVVFSTQPLPDSVTSYVECSGAV